MNYRVWIPAYDNEPGNYPIAAANHEDAAHYWAQMYDEDRGYPIASGEDVTVYVKGDDGSLHAFYLSGQLKTTYYTDPEEIDP